MRQMRWKMTLPGCLAILLAGVAATLPASAEQRGATVGPGAGAGSGTGAVSSGAVVVQTEPVRGLGCYTFGDDTNPKQAKELAMAEARRAAVESHQVYVQSATQVKNFQLENDVTQSASAGVLQDVRIESKEEKGREICITITAKFSPAKLEELIQQKSKNKDVAKATQAPVLQSGGAFGVKVWTNKTDGHFVENDRLVVFVQSDRDGYLKVDYFQADNTVVHLVPNPYRGEVYVKAGQIFTFGGDGDQEKFTITPPFGHETIKAFVSTSRYQDPLSADRKSPEDSTAYLQDLKRGSRGVTMGAGTGAAQWAEAFIGLDTKDKSVDDYERMARGTRGIGKRSGLPPEPTKPTPTTATPGSRPDDGAPRP